MFVGKGTDQLLLLKSNVLMLTALSNVSREAVPEVPFLSRNQLDPMKAGDWTSPVTRIGRRGRQWESGLN